MKIVVLDGYTENPGDLSWGGFEDIAVDNLKQFLAGKPLNVVN